MCYYVGVPSATALHGEDQELQRSWDVYKSKDYNIEPRQRDSILSVLGLDSERPQYVYI